MIFFSEDRIVDFVSLMGNNLIPGATTIGDKYTYFLSDNHEDDEHAKIEEETLMDPTTKSLDSFEYHNLKHGETVFIVI